MVTSRKLIVKQLPKKVCISIRTTRGRTLAKTRNVKRGKRTVKRKKGRRVSKLKGGVVTRCAKRRTSRKACVRLARAGCLTSRGTIKKKKVCRSMSRNRGLKPKSYRRSRSRSALGMGIGPRGGFFGQSLRQLGDLAMP